MSLFDNADQPHAPMAIVTKCERVQPTCAGINAQGELVWEGREMAYWQMLMVKVHYVGDFFAHWMKKDILAATGYESEPSMPSMDIQALRGWEKKRKRRPMWGD